MARLNDQMENMTLQQSTLFRAPAIFVTNTLLTYVTVPDHQFLLKYFIIKGKKEN